MKFPIQPKNFWRRVKYNSFRYIYRILYRLVYKPDFVADRDWGTLIVLDGCRFDVFSCFNTIPGNLNRVISPGSSTPEWLQKNFCNVNMKDVIYISANPYASYYYLHKKLGYVPFYKIVEVWKGCWNEELNTVHPSAVNEATLKSLKLHHSKRHIIHYMQPHHPFIGDFSIKGAGWRHAREKMLGRKKRPGRTPYTLLKEGRISKSRVWRAYVSNLQLVLGYVRKLLPSLVGKVCITSDHGNVFGKFDLFFGHPMYCPLPGLLEVPWFDVARDGTEQIQADNSLSKLAIPAYNKNVSKPLTIQ